jgi:two-component system alkaline phosphatase synthesis response regulator PhoP
MDEELKILVADDDPDILDSMTMVLESGGYTVITARDGEEALTKLQTARPRLLILDLLMPRKDGFAVLKDLQFEEKWALCKKQMFVVVLSSVREEFARRRYYLETAMELGSDDYLEKPVSPQELLSIVARFVKSAGQAV